MNRGKLLLMGQDACGNAPFQARKYADRINADDTFKNYVAKMMQDLCYKGIYKKLDIMYLMSGTGLDNYGKEYFSDSRNMKFLNANGVEDKSGFTANRGLKTDGEHYVDTGYAPKVTTSAGKTEITQVHFILSEDTPEINPYKDGGYLYGTSEGAYSGDYLYLLRRGNEVRIKKSYEARLLSYKPVGGREGVYTIENYQGRLNVYKNGELYQSRGHEFKFQAALIPYYLFALNHHNLEFGYGISRAEMQFWGASKTLTPLQIKQFHKSLTDYQTFLNRKTW